MSVWCRFDQCLGLGLGTTPNGLVCDPKTGRYQLAEAVNVDVTHGRLRLRPGLTRFLELGVHSLFSDGPNLYAGHGDKLSLLPGQGEPRLLRTGLTAEARLAFVAVGGSVYFSNGFETGVIRDDIAGPWGAAVYPGPDPDGRYVTPPAGHLLAHFAGRLWIARDDAVLFTEGAGLFDWLDGLAGFLPPATGRVRMLRAVENGLFIGDAAGVRFAAGKDPGTMTFARVCPTPPIPGSDATIPPGCQARLAGQPLSGQAAIWAGRDGLYLGRPDGRVERAVPAAFPAADHAAAVVTKTRYLLSLAS